MPTLLCLALLTATAQAGSSTARVETAEGSSEVEVRSTRSAPENDSSDGESSDGSSGDGFDGHTGIKIWDDEWSTGDSVWGDTYDTPVGDFSYGVLGYEADAEVSVGIRDGQAGAHAEAEATAYLAQVGYSGELMFGDEQTHAQIQAEAEAFVGAEAKAEGDVTVGLDGIGAEGELEAFAGAKAEGEIPVDLAFCDIGLDASVEGEASAGIGGEASGSAEANWSEMEFGVSGSLAGTLGLGAGAGGEVTLDLGGVLDPAGTADCVWDNVWELGEGTVGVVDDVWDAGWGAGEDLIGGIGDLFGGGGDDEMDALVQVVTDQLRQQQQLREEQLRQDVIRRIDRQMDPGIGPPGMCL